MRKIRINNKKNNNNNEISFQGLSFLGKFTSVGSEKSGIFLSETMMQAIANTATETMTIDGLWTSTL